MAVAITLPNRSGKVQDSNPFPVKVVNATGGAHGLATEALQASSFGFSDWGFRQVIRDYVGEDYSRISFIRKTSLGGSNPTVDPDPDPLHQSPEILSEASTPLIDPGTDIQYFVNSDNAADNALVLAQMYQTDKTLVNDTTTLNGHSQVPFSNFNARFVKNGLGLGRFEGNLYIAPDLSGALTNGVPNDLTKVRMKIPPARQVSTNPMLWLGAGQYAYFEWWNGYINTESKGVPSVGALYNGETKFEFFPRFPVGTGGFEVNKKYGIIFEPNTFIFLTADSGTVNTEMSAEYSFLLFTIT